MISILVKNTCIYVATIVISLGALGNLAVAQTGKFTYGFNAALNYPTIGGKFDMYSGEGNPTLSLYIAYKPDNGLSIGHPTQNKTYTVFSDEFVRHLAFVLQPSFSAITFRQQDIDRKYNNYYLELTGLVYIQPFTYVTEISFFTGIRPSYLASYNTELFENGYYTSKQFDANQNTIGRIDLSVPVGISLELSEAVNLELVYNHSFTNFNTEQIIKGRPSTIELSLKLNALGLVNQFSKKEEALRTQIRKLSKGALLVMLPTPNPSEIRHLKTEMKEEEIQEIYAELLERNKKVMREFKSNFDFCPVYYFLDTSAYKIISKKFDNVFGTANMEPDPFIKTDSSNFFVGSFCNDISIYTTKHVFGLFVYDDKINQLQKPFNVPINLVGGNLSGDPLNFFKTHYSYSNYSFDRIIKKFCNRLSKYRDQ